MVLRTENAEVDEAVAGRGEDYGGCWFRFGIRDPADMFSDGNCAHGCDGDERDVEVCKLEDAGEV